MTPPPDVNYHALAAQGWLDHLLRVGVEREAHMLGQINQLSAEVQTLTARVQELEAEVAQGTDALQPAQDAPQKDGYATNFTHEALR